MPCISLHPFLHNAGYDIHGRRPEDDDDLPTFAVSRILAQESTYRDVREMAECFVKGSISFSSLPWINYENKFYKIFILELRFSINNLKNCLYY